MNFKIIIKIEIENQHFLELIKNYLKFEIIKKIEEKYKDFKKFIIHLKPVFLKMF